MIATVGSITALSHAARMILSVHGCDPQTADPPGQPVMNVLGGLERRMGTPLRPPELSVIQDRPVRFVAAILSTSDLPAPLHPENAVRRMEDEDPAPNQSPTGTAAIMRAVDILIAVADGPISLPDLVAKVNIPKQTCHRIATALAERGLLATSGRSGYRLGPALRELANRSQI